MVTTWDKYSITAAATGQLSLAETFAHKDDVLHIAARAKAVTNGWGLSICYDEVVCKSWAMRAFNSDASLDLERECRTLDEAALKQAEALYDERGSRNSSSKGKGKGSPASYNWPSDAGRKRSSYWEPQQGARPPKRGRYHL